MATNREKSKTSAVIITLIVVALVAAGILWYMQSQNGADNTSYNTEKLSENLKGIEAQDEKYKSITSLQLQPVNNVEEHYQVLRPLEQVATGEQNEQTSSGPTLTAVQAYALGKNGEDGKARYNASFFTYKLEGEIASKSTDQIVKSQLDAAMAQAEQSQQPNGATVTVGEPEKATDIAMKTDSGETVKLASSKFEQTITNGSAEKKLVSLVAAAKFGNQLLFINATFADEAAFSEASQHVQDMANFVTLKLST